MSYLLFPPRLDEIGLDSSFRHPQQVYIQDMGDFLRVQSKNRVHYLRKRDN